MEYWMKENQVAWLTKKTFALLLCVFKNACTSHLTVVQGGHRGREGESLLFMCSWFASWRWPPITFIMKVFLWEKQKQVWVLVPPLLLTSSNFRAVVLKFGFESPTLPTLGTLATSGDVSGCHIGEGVHVVDRSQECCHTSCSTWDSPSTPKTYPGPNVSNA